MQDPVDLVTVGVLRRALYLYQQTQQMGFSRIGNSVHIGNEHLSALSDIGNKLYLQPYLQPGSLKQHYSMMQTHGLRNIDNIESVLALPPVKVLCGA